MGMGCLFRRTIVTGEDIILPADHALPALKWHAKVSGHYVNSILATQEAKDLGFDEALLLDMKDLSQKVLAPTCSSNRMAFYIHHSWKHSARHHPRDGARNL